MEVRHKAIDEKKRTRLSINVLTINWCVREKNYPFENNSNTYSTGVLRYGFKTYEAAEKYLRNMAKKLGYKVVEY